MFIMTTTICIASFLSTLSLRRATEDANDSSNANLHFYPRSPCGERLVMAVRLMYNLYFYPRSPCGERPRAANCQHRSHHISIHALLAESDQATNGLANTPPKISIHALLAESDRIRQRNKLQDGNFYPRSPCGERLYVCWTVQNRL